MSTHRGVGKSMRSLPTPWEKVIFGGPFPPRGGGLFLHSFSFWGHCFIFWGYFLYVGGGEAVSTYIEKFLGLFPLPKIGAHGLLE